MNWRWALVNPFKKGGRRTALLIDASELNRSARRSGIRSRGGRAGLVLDVAFPDGAGDIGADDRISDETTARLGAGEWHLDRMVGRGVADEDFRGASVLTGRRSDN